MKTKLIFKEYSNGILMNSFKRIATKEDHLISFKSDYNDKVTIKLLDDSVLINREGVINYLIKHEKNKEETQDISIDGLGIKESLKVKIVTKDLTVIKNSDSIFIKIDYKKDDEEIITNYEIRWRENE